MTVVSELIENTGFDVTTQISALSKSDKELNTFTRGLIVHQTLEKVVPFGVLMHNSDNLIGNYTCTPESVEKFLTDLLNRLAEEQKGADITFEGKQLVKVVVTTKAIDSKRFAVVVTAVTTNRGE